MWILHFRGERGGFCGPRWPGGAAQDGAERDPDAPEPSCRCAWPAEVERARQEEPAGPLEHVDGDVAEAPLARGVRFLGLRSRSSLGGVEEESRGKTSKVTLRRAASEPPRTLGAGLERAGSPPPPGYRKQQSKNFEHATPPREKHRTAWSDGKDSKAGLWMPCDAFIFEKCGVAVSGKQAKTSPQPRPAAYSKNSASKIC